MLVSMTGFGDARGDGPGYAVAVEVRSVNNRHLKVSVRGSEPYASMEADVEKIVRKGVRRGSVLVHIRVTRPEGNAPRLNVATVRAYLDLLRATCDDAGTPNLLPALASGVLALPGVMAESVATTAVPDEEWATVERALTEAIAALDVSRKAEGRTMADELGRHREYMADQLAAVRDLLPAVTRDYRERLLERVRQALMSAGAGLEPDHIVREVALFADRTDVSEEMSRFLAHLQQFAEVVESGSEGAGRRLEFIAQEMGREANTLGSKAGDVAISRHVIEIKATLEKIRELIQNVE